MGTSNFGGIQGPIIIGPNQFQKRDYTPAYQEAQRVEVQKELNIEGTGHKDSNSTNTEMWDLVTKGKSNLESFTG